MTKRTPNRWRLRPPPPQAFRLASRLYTSSRRKPIARWRLWRIVDGRKRLLLRSETTELVLAAVDTAGTRIVIRRPAPRIEILNDHGVPINSNRLHGELSRKLFLDGTSLVRRTKTAIEVIDVSNGALQHRWLLRRAAALEDVEEGQAVYVSAGAIHFLRLSDGHHTAGLRVVGMQNPGPDHVQLQPQGLFVARTIGIDGRVAFIPRRALPPGLR